MKSVQKVQLLLKLNTNIGYFAWRPKYVLLLQETKNSNKSIIVSDM